MQVLCKTSSIVLIIHGYVQLIGFFARISLICKKTYEVHIHKFAC